MKNNRSGFSVVEIMVVIGMLAVVSLGIMTLVSNLMKSVNSAQRGANRTDTMKSISTALSNNETCGGAMGAGVLDIPAAWATGAANALDINSIQVGADVLAQVGVTKNGVRITAMKLEMVTGPFPVQYNTTAPPAAPVIKNYRRYFATLTVSSEKEGGAQNNVGGEKMRDSVFSITFLADDTNKLFDCFGGMDEADTAAMCEKAFDGEYNANSYPWCTPRSFSVGIKQDDMPGGAQINRVRFGVMEKQRFNAVSGAMTDDATMALFGNGAANSNGPGLWFLGDPGQNTAGSGNLAVIGFAQRVNAYGGGPVKGDLSIANRKSGGNILTSVINAAGTEQNNIYLKSDGRVAIGGLLNPQGILDVNFTTAQGGPIIRSRDSQGTLSIFGPSDANRTYSALYLADNSFPNIQTNSWVLGHKGPNSAGGDHSFLLGHWVGGNLTSPFNITPAGDVVINNSSTAAQLMITGISAAPQTYSVAYLGVSGSTYSQDSWYMAYKSNPAGTFAIGKWAGGANMTALYIYPNGNIQANGTVTAASDERLKKDFSPISGALDKILNIKGYFFRWKDEHKGKEKQIGVKAQDVEKVFPELVLTGADGLKSVAYQNLVAPIIEAIRELYDKITGLIHRESERDLEIEKLKKENQEIKAALCEISPKARVCGSKPAKTKDKK